MSGYQLTKEIICLSQAQTWDEAKLEWQLVDVYDQEEPDTCLCGHFPINEICVLRNERNGRVTEVGNICVKKFLGLPSEKIFQALRRISKDDSKALNAEGIQHASDRGWLNDWETNFCFDTMRKRTLSENQLAKRREINQLVLRQTRRKRNAGVVMPLKPIETHYNGYRFRSRLEAKWAVFFDVLGLRYEYEREGFDLDGRRYLPDFWLPEKDCWVEIKGAEPHYVLEKHCLSEDMTKCMLLARHSGKSVLWLKGQIPNLRLDLRRYGFPVQHDEFYALECQKVTWYEVTPSFDFERTGWEGLEICFPHSACSWLYNEKALLRARQAAFEHGESGGR